MCVCVCVCVSVGVSYIRHDPSAWKKRWKAIFIAS